jgi:hypothetical protein
MTTRTQNLLSVAALVAAFLISLLPEAPPAASRAGTVPLQVSQLAQ